MGGELCFLEEKGNWTHWNACMEKTVDHMLEPFQSWEKALTYVHRRQMEEALVLVMDEFPYLAEKNPAILSVLQHLIDHKMQDGKLFLVLCGSYMGFMEKEVLGAKSPLFGRRTGQLHMKPFDYKTSAAFLDGFSDEEKMMVYGMTGGTPLYLAQVQSHKTLKQNVMELCLSQTGYLYDEPKYLLQQEVQQPGVYNAIIEAIAAGASKANEISTKSGEEPAKVLKYIKTLIELGIIHRETPFGEKESSRKSIYRISDFMFRFWYRYVFCNRTLLETDAQELVWNKRIVPDYNDYMGIVFEQICKEYLLGENAKGNLPVLFTSIGRWWGTNSKKRTQEEIDLIAGDGQEFLICECKWRNEPLDYGVLQSLREKADAFSENRKRTWYLLFSKSGYSQGIRKAAEKDGSIMLFTLEDLLK